MYACEKTLLFFLTNTKTSDYREKLSQRNTAEILKKELDILFGQCLVDCSSESFKMELLDSRKALTYSSNPPESLKPLMQEMINSIRKGDCAEASKILRKIKENTSNNLF